MPFDSLNLSSLVALWECDSGLYQDAGFSIPATADASPVKGWKDRTGNHNDATEGTSSPVIHMIGGVPSVAFLGSQKLAVTLGASISANTSYTAHVLCAVDPRALAAVLSTATPSASVLLAPTWTTGGIIGLNSGPTGPDVCEDGNIHLFSVSYSSTTMKCWVDGAPVFSTPISVSLPAISDLHMGEYPGVGAKAHILAMAFASAVHSDADVANLAAFYRAKFSAAWPLQTNLLLWDCNSLGTGLYVGNSYQTVPYLSTKYTTRGGMSWVNLSRGGYTTTQLIADLATRLGGLSPQKLSCCALILWEGRNDMVVNSLTPRQAADNYRTYCQLARTLGVEKVAVATVIATDHNSSGTADSTWNTANRDPFNALIMAEWPTYADAIIPVHLLAKVGAAGANTNTTYFQSDGVHLTAAGSQEAANGMMSIPDTLLGVTGGDAGTLGTTVSSFVRRIISRMRS